MKPDPIPRSSGSSPTGDDSPSAATPATEATSHIAQAAAARQIGDASNVDFWEICAAANSRHSLRSRLETEIDGGRLGVGVKLPTEREIAERCALSRSNVRSVLQELERSGRIVREVGRGTFVAQRVAAMQSARLSVAPRDLVEMRVAIEPALANLVVYNATAEDLASMESTLVEARAVRTWLDAESCDARFHDLFYRASHNEGIRQVANLILDARRSDIWLRIKQSTYERAQWEEYHLEHTQIFEQIAARDAAGARKLILQHLVGVQRRMV